MPRSHDIEDFYKVLAGGDGGVLLRRWGMVEVEPAVLVPRITGAPLSLLEASDEEITAVLTGNAEVRALVAAGEPAPEPVERPVYDAEGNQTGTELVALIPPPPPPPLPPASHRTLRSMAYLTQIGGSLSLLNAAGNQFDALWHDRQGSPAQLSQQDAIIAAIKARYRPDAPWRALWVSLGGNHSGE